MMFRRRQNQVIHFFFVYADFKANFFIPCGFMDFVLSLDMMLLSTYFTGIFYSFPHPFRCYLYNISIFF